MPTVEVNGVSLAYIEQGGGPQLSPSLSQLGDPGWRRPFGAHPRPRPGGVLTRAGPGARASGRPRGGCVRLPAASAQRAWVDPDPRPRRATGDVVVGVRRSTEASAAPAVAGPQ